MSFPKRSDSAVPQFRMRVPAGLAGRITGRRITISLPGVGREDPRMVEALIGPREIKFSLRTRDETVAAAWRRSAQADLERFFTAVEAGPVKLTHKDLVALSGAVYRLYQEAHLEEPGDPDVWAAFKAFARAAAEGRILRAPALAVGDPGDDEAAFATFGEDLTAGINSRPISDSVTALEGRFGALASWVLAREGIDLDAATRVLLLRQIASASVDVGWALKRAAQGDYTPDPNAARFPEFRKANATSLRDVFERWQRETRPAASTVSNWTTVLDRLERELRTKANDIGRISPDDIIAFKDALIAKNLSHKTVADTYLAATKALFNFAVANRIIAISPAAAVKVVVKVLAGEGKLPYTDAEVARLLALSEREKLAHVRWLPLLAATTGARISELTQLWGDRVFVRDGIHCMHIAPAPDGGSLKNAGSERVVPIHPEVVRRGFLDFVAKRGSGPIFYNRSKVTSKPRKGHASKGPANRVSEWVRANGFEDPRKDPSHGLRHWWKSAAVRAKVSDSIADAIQGHTGKGEASRYRHFDLPTLAEAIAAMPVPSVRIDQDAP